MGKMKKVVGVGAMIGLLMLGAVPAFAAVHTYSDQDVTAYVRYDTATKTSSGSDYFWGVGAVRSTSGCCTPIIPYNTQVQTSQQISSPIGAGNTFFVKDTGTGTGLSLYWLDIWWGEWGNQDSALSFGDHKMTLTYYY